VMPRPVLKPGPDPPASHGDPGPQVIPLQLGHELGGICGQPGHRSGQHQRDAPSGTAQNGSFRPRHNGLSGPQYNDSSWVGADPSRRRLLERLGKLDEALVDGRISLEQYEEMRARAEQEFAGWEA